MKFTKNFIAKFIFVCFLLASGSVFADFKSEIIKSCKAYQQGIDRSEINPCKLYIDGFIDSSLLSESAVVKPEALIDNLRSPVSDFVKRAYNTRVTARSSLTEKGGDHAFCIPLEEDRRKVVSKIAKSMKIDDLETKYLKEVLFETLVSDFPC
jgi:hypothetical protein